MENLRTALRLKLEQGPLNDTQAQRLGKALGLGVVQRPLLQLQPQGGAKVLHGADHAGRDPAGVLFAHPRHAFEQALDRRLVSLQLVLALRSHGVELAAALALLGGDQACFLEQGEGGIDHARAGAVGAADAILDFLDDLIAVPRLLGDQGQHHPAKIAVVEDASAAAAAPARAVPAAHAIEMSKMAVAAKSMVSHICVLLMLSSICRIIRYV